jgi:hypothetical protein
MIPFRSQTGIRLRVALALFVLLLGAIAPAARLWLPEPVTCGMACCEASGVCYCGHHHNRGESETAVSDANAAKLTAALISRSCPARCAQLPAGFQKHSIARAHPPRIAFITSVIWRSSIRTPFLARDALIADAHSPRAPPVRRLRNQFIRFTAPDRRRCGFACGDARNYENTDCLRRLGADPLFT